MSELREILSEKIKHLSDDELATLNDFIDSLKQDKAPDKKSTLLSLSGSLSFSPLSSEEIDEELYGKRVKT